MVPTTTTLRRAGADELPSLNARWQAVGFVLSAAEDVVVVVEDAAANVVGSGRLVPSGDGSFELGGMLVDESQRGQGLGRRIVARLVEEAAGAALWCIPFAEVQDLYRGFGFHDAQQEPPQKVKQKWDFCCSFYSKPCVLLCRDPLSS